jgi:crotonobetainyl-CoA:carnitine CoA-transferase CaiB-like acyl-CoA transferase
MSGLAPLAGLSVVNLARGVAGGYAARLLADAGAQVANVEIAPGDPLRFAAAGIRSASQDYALYEHLRAGQSIVRLAPGDPLDTEIMRAVADADIVIQGSDSQGAGEFTYRLPASTGADRAAVVVDISPFGRYGRWADRPGNEFVAEAWAGRLLDTGVASVAAPVADGASSGAWMAGTYAAVCAVAYLRLAELHHRVVYVDLSILESLLTASVGILNAQLRRDATDSRGPVAAPPGTHQTSDGHLVMFGIATGPQWVGYCNMVGRADWRADASLTRLSTRADRSAELVPWIDEWTSARTAVEINELCAEFRVPVGIVTNGKTTPALACFADSFLVDADSGLLRPRSALRFTGGDAPVRAGSTSAGEAAPSTPERPERPLAGVCVLDCTAFWAGPLASSIVAALGADVIHVESPVRADGMRALSAKSAAERDWLEWAPVFHLNNPSKRAISVDLLQRDGLALLRRLIARSDVIIENSLPRLMDSLGMDWPGVQDIRGDIVMVRMPSFGIDNPWRERPAFQMNMEAFAGISYRCGRRPGDLPTSPNITDASAGMHGAFGVVCGVRHRTRTGGGMHAEVRLSEVAIAVAAEPVVVAARHGTVLGMRGNRALDGGPQGVYRCGSPSQDDSGDWVAVSVGTDEQWQALNRLMGEPAWTRELPLQSSAGRTDQADRLDEELARWLMGKPAAEVVDALAQAGVPAAIVARPAIVPRYPTLADRQYFAQLVHPVCGPLEYPGLPVRVSIGADGAGSRVLPTQHYRPAPTWAQDDVSVLGSLIGVTAEEYADLARRGVVGSDRAQPAVM